MHEVDVDINVLSWSQYFTCDAHFLDSAIFLENILKVPCSSLTWNYWNGTDQGRITTELGN